MAQDKKSPEILCVDDEKLNLKLLKSILEPEGYEFRGAESGEIALAQVAQEMPDLIFLDIMMPKMTGFEVLEKLRKDEKTRLIPVVMVTALRETEDRVSALEAGCDDFISKPFDKIELLARAQSLLRISYYRRQLDEKEKFEAAIHDMDEGVVICNSEWEIKDINASAEKYLYLNKDEASSINLFELILKNYSLSISREKLLELSEPHKIFDLIRPETKQFKSLCLEAKLDILKNPDGEASSIVMTLRDVTELRNERFLKQDFLSLISHKLRTPVTIIGESASLLWEGAFDPLSEKQKKPMEALLNKTSQLKVLINKLIEFTKIFSQNFDLLKEPIDLKSYLPQIADSVARQNEGKKVEVNVSFEDGPVVIKLSKVLLGLIAENLIENAIKFNDKEIIIIDLAVKGRKDNIEISVSDNGPGIPVEEQDNIFERFYQMEKRFTGNVEGIGMGLAITKYLVLACRGTITVESSVNKGAKFTLVLPINRDSDHLI